MGCKGSEVQILSPRPINSVCRESTVSTFVSTFDFDPGTSVIARGIRHSPRRPTMSKSEDISLRAISQRPDEDYFVFPWRSPGLPIARLLRQERVMAPYMEALT